MAWKINYLVGCVEPSITKLPRNYIHIYSFHTRTIKTGITAETGNSIQMIILTTTSLWFEWSLLKCGKLSNMCHPFCTISKVRINDYCTRRGVPRRMAYSHIKE